MDDFCGLLDDCSLADLGFVRYPFTWNNKRPGLENTMARLDKAVTNTDWREKFQESLIIHFFSHASDHRPVLLHARIALRCRGRSTRAFRFEES